MMEYQLSIDFGNSFTKIGIRPAAPVNEEGKAFSSADLLQDDWLRMDENNFCIPTLAARGEENGRETWWFGNEVVAKASNRAGVEIYRNWKPRFFEDVETHLNGAPNPPSEEGLAPADWESVQGDYGVATAPAVRVATQPRVATSSDAFPVREIGLGYFTWLRNFVNDYCVARGLPEIDQVPVRITLPSFGAQTAAAHRLVELLAEAGWCPAQLRPAVAEPVANSIGIFSEGRNAIWTPPPMPAGMPRGTFAFYPEMFGDSLFFTATRNYACLNNDYEMDRTHWVFVADLGGYTADFAMLGFDLARPDRAFEEAAAAEGRFAHYSEPIGIAGLDAEVRAGLPENQRAAFDSMLHSVDPRLETFHRLFYATYRPFRSEGVRIGEGDGVIDQVRESVDGFAQRVATFAERFLDMHQFERVDQLLVTGGGYNVPAVRDALVRKLETYQLQRVYRPINRQEGPVPDRHAALDARSVRGSTALGGASVYFESGS